MYISIRNKTLVTVTTVLISLLIFGCSESPESVFLDKLKTKITEEGERCLDEEDVLDLKFLEYDGKRYLSVSKGWVEHKRVKGEAMIKRLHEAGYLSGATKKIPYFYSDWAGYELNDKGREHIHWGKGVCVGRMNATEIIEYTEPADMGGMVITSVKYKYDVAMNDVVHDLGLEEKVKALMPGEGTATFIKTSKGWRLETYKVK